MKSAEPVSVILAFFYPEVEAEMLRHLESSMKASKTAREFRKTEISLQPRLGRADKAFEYAFNDSGKIILSYSGLDPVEGAMRAAFLAQKYQVRALIYAGGCGLLSDQYRLLDVFVPDSLYRSDLEYHDRRERALFVPDWPNPIMGAFLDAYSLELQDNPLAKKLQMVGLSPEWASLAKQIVANHPESTVSRDSIPAIIAGSRHITGAAFVAGPMSRKRYSDYFKVDSVDMRAHQIIRSAKILEIPSAAAMSCADRAGEDQPGDSLDTFSKNYPACVELSLLAAVLALRG